jgi:hypothetical protein
MMVGLTSFDPPYTWNPSHSNADIDAADGLLDALLRHLPITAAQVDANVGKRRERLCLPAVGGPPRAQPLQAGLGLHDAR